MRLTVLQMKLANNVAIQYCWEDRKIMVTTILAKIDKIILVVNVVQTSDLSWEFLKIENKQLENKLSRTFLVDKTGVEPLIFV